MKLIIYIYKFFALGMGRPFQRQHILLTITTFSLQTFFFESSTHFTGVLNGVCCPTTFNSVSMALKNIKK